MKILVAGATGTVGTPLVESLLAQTDPPEVIVIGRSTEKIVQTFGDKVTAETWDSISAETLQAIDAAINLAGENVGGILRWTSEYMQKILDSRITTTSRLARLLAESGSRARLLNASGISIYGHQEYDSTEIKDEDSAVPKSHTDFLTDVTIKWEAAAAALLPESQIVFLRIGIVLCAGGGALGKMELPFKLGLGGPLGPGSQAMSWISLADAVRSICFILDRPEITGPVNLVSGFVAQADFAQALADALHRPCLLPAPSFALRMVLGSEMAHNLVLVNHRIDAKRLRDHGFQFDDTDLRAVMRRIYE
eukprot:TRINITY_DN48012_c0_g1_i1.p1 TRINITY_DN48012_c0_g1~~TRINITY_DN48012_c0_g1_i1.p1  ORF type:complete len:308 (+),score=40.75 TRINITY_DN48012_c0_g1_i1:62-985(+)